MIDRRHPKFGVEIIYQFPIRGVMWFLLLLLICVNVDDSSHVYKLSTAGAFGICIGKMCVKCEMLTDCIEW